MSVPVHSAVASLRVLTEGILDYAGLFPPTSLEMRRGVDNYASYLRHPQRWVLGKFVLRAAQLDEFLEAREGRGQELWHLSAILSGGIAAGLAAVDAFHRRAGGAVIDSLEIPVSTPEEMGLVSRNLPPHTAVFFEISSERAAELLPAVSRAGGCAKLRTGCVMAEAFPSIETIVNFLVQCAELRVPFKATAGLHHPLRCTRRLTNERDSPRGEMNGFLNLFTAAAIAWSARSSGRQAPREALAACLADGERTNWHFGDDALTWSGHSVPVRLEVDSLRAMRSRFALSFGSCSFEEPIEEMRELDLL